LLPAASRSPIIPEPTTEWLKNFLVRVAYQQRQGTREYIMNHWTRK
jgi:hypothetical protein